MLTILIIILLLISIYKARALLIRYRDSLRIFVGMSLIISRMTLDVWYVTTGTWSASHSLPLELCSIASLAAGIMLLTKNRSLFEVVYFIGIGGAIQAILTPNLHFGFPQFRFIQFFTDHFLLILAPLLMIWLYNYTVTKMSIVKTFISINVLALIIWMINYIISANYMFLRHKPNTTSLLDFLGPYPVYLLSLEIITIIVFILLYVPFMKRKST